MLSTSGDRKCKTSPSLLVHGDVYFYFFSFTKILRQAFSKKLSWAREIPTEKWRGNSAHPLRAFSQEILITSRSKPSSVFHACHESREGVR